MWSDAVSKYSIFLKSNFLATTLSKRSCSSPPMHGALSIHCLGKLKQPYAITAVAHYEKLLRRSLRIDWRFIDEKPLRKLQTRDAQQDAAATLLLESVPDGAVPVLLHEGGKLRDSRQFAEWLTPLVQESPPPVFLIAGAFGTGSFGEHPRLQRISLSPLTMPHEMAVVVLLEQLYRTGTIIDGKEYHY